MPYAVLEKKIQTLPKQGLEELSHYVDYLQFVYRNNEKKERYSDSLRRFRTAHSDFLSDDEATKDLDNFFDSLRDKSELLRSTEEELW